VSWLVCRRLGLTIWGGSALLRSPLPRIVSRRGVPKPADGPAVTVSGESVIRARRFRDLPSARVTAGPHRVRNPPAPAISSAACRREFRPADTLGIPRPIWPCGMRAVML
jgi:hypothetical protein